MKTLIRFSNGLQKFASVRYILPLLAVFFLLVSLMDFGPDGQRALRQINHGAGMLDLEKSGYSPDQAYAMFARIGDAGRGLYTRLLGLDYPFAIVFMVLQSLLITRLMQRAEIHGRWGLLNLLPYLRSGLDLIENCLLLALLFSYPVQLPLIVRIASLVTTTKLVIHSHIMVLVMALGMYTGAKSALSQHTLKTAQKTV